MQNNPLIAFLKFFAFLIIFCFIVEFNTELLRIIRGRAEMSLSVLYFSSIAALACYIFFVDLNDLYKKSQLFFMRTRIVTLIVPSFLILLGLVFLIFPKVFNFSYNRAFFLFLGGFALTIHMIFVAREIKGTTFVDFINYLFMLSVFYLLNLVFFVIYLKIAFHIDFGRFFSNGFINGALLIRDLFTQLF